MNWYDYQLNLINEIKLVYDKKSLIGTDNVFIINELNYLNEQLINLKNDYDNILIKLNQQKIPIKNKWLLYENHTNLLYNSSNENVLNIIKMEGIRISIENNLKWILNYINTNY